MPRAKDGLPANDEDQKYLQNRNHRPLLDLDQGPADRALDHPDIIPSAPAVDHQIHHSEATAIDQ